MARSTAWDALGRDAEIHVRGRVERDDAGFYVTDTDGRRWNLRWDDLVTLAPAPEAA